MRSTVLQEPCMTAQREVHVSVAELNEISWGLYLARLNSQARLNDAMRVYNGDRNSWAVQNAEEDLNNIRCAEIVLNRIVERAYVAPVVGVMSGGEL